MVLHNQFILSRTDAYNGKNVICNCQLIGELGKPAQLGREANVQTVSV